MILKIGDFYDMCYGEIIKEPEEKLVDYTGTILKVAKKNPYGEDTFNDRGMVFIKLPAEDFTTFVISIDRKDVLIQDIVNYNLILKGD